MREQQKQYEPISAILAGAIAAVAILLLGAVLFPEEDKPVQDDRDGADSAIEHFFGTAKLQCYVEGCFQRGILQMVRISGWNGRMLIRACKRHIDEINTVAEAFHRTHDTGEAAPAVEPEAAQPPPRDRQKYSAEWREALPQRLKLAQEVGAPIEAADLKLTQAQIKQKYAGKTVEELLGQAPVVEPEFKA